MTRRRGNSTPCSRCRCRFWRRPLCPFGYRLVANGYDTDRQRHKFFCSRVCSQGQEPVVVSETAPQPLADCPYLSSANQHGLILNVGERFADGSIRLVRDVLVGSATWKRLYHRPRNASEEPALSLS